MVALRRETILATRQKINKKGSALPIVIAVVLSVSLLGVSLIQTSTLDCSAFKWTKEHLKNFYLAEAAILQNLYGNVEPTIFKVEKEKSIWNKVCTTVETEKLCAVYGISPDVHLHALPSLEALERFRALDYSLQRKKIPKDTLYGNRTFSEIFKGCVMVENGDVVVRMNFSSGNLCLISSGDIRVDAFGNLDSLFLRAGGNIHLLGEWRAQYVELRARETLSLTSQQIAGLITASKINIGQNALIKFPSLIVSKSEFWNDNTNEINVHPTASIEGIVWNASSRKFEIEKYLNQKIKANFLGFSREISFHENLPIPPFFSDEQGYPIILEWK